MTFNRSLTNLEDVRSHLEEQSREHHDHLVPAKDIYFDDLKTIRLGVERHPLRPAAARSITNRLGIPFPYLERCPADVQAFNLNHWVRKEKREELFFRFDGEHVRAIFTPKYVPVDNLPVIDRLLDLGLSGKTKVQARVDGEFMFLNVPDTGKSFVVGRDDQMMPGISIGNSEVGLASLSIAAFVLRLVCTNGLIAREKTATTSFRHVSTKVLENLPGLLSGAAASAQGQRDALTFSLVSPVHDPQETFERLNKRFQVPEEGQEALKWAWPYEVGNTMFNVVQTYTRASQYPTLAADCAYHLQRVGGEILSLVRSDNYQEAA